MIDFYFVHVPKTAGASFCMAFNMPLGDHTPASQLPDGFKAAVVRNPYDRVQSAFHFARDGERQHTLQGTFRDFVMGDDWRNVLFTPMVDLIDAPVGFIGRFETLQADYQRLCAIVGREPLLPHLHRTAVKEPYDDAMREVVYKRYRDDFVRFGYGP